MAHEDRSNMSQNTELNVESSINEPKTTQQQLADANNEIAELKLQIAWLERFIRVTAFRKLKIL